MGHPPAGLGGVMGKFGGRRSSVRALHGPKHGKHLSIPTNEHRASRKQKIGGKMGWKKSGMKLGEQTSHLVHPHCRDEPSSPSQPYWNHKHYYLFYFFSDLGLCSSFPGGFAGAQNVVVVPKSCPVAAPARGDAKRTSTGMERDKIKRNKIKARLCFSS